MGGRTDLLRWLALAAVGFTFSCGDNGGDGDAAEGGGASGGAAVFGDARPSSNRDVAERIATRAVDAAVSSCGGNCSADIAAGNASMADGHMLDAWNAFKCADSPEAAFGAGIARVLGVLESEAGDGVMSDLGLPHLPASDLLGPNGWLSRLAGRWNGSAQLNVTGGLELQIDSEHVQADDWQLELRTDVGSKRVQFTIETDASWTPGTVIAPQYECANAGSSRGSIPFVSLDVRDGDDELDCQVPSSLAATACVPSGGMLHVVSSGQTQGNHVELELSDLLLECQHHDNSQVDSDLAPRPTVMVHVSGRTTADVVLEVDTSGLHPIFQNEDDLLLKHIPANVASTSLMNHAAAVAGEIASARCYFAKAAEGTGTVFTLPGALYGGHDLPLGAADARMLASASGLAAATLELGTSYELDMSLQQVACGLDNGRAQFPACKSAQDFVGAVNGKLRSAVTRHDRLGATRALLALALDDFIQGEAQLDDASALVRDEISAPGWDLALEIAQTAKASLEGRIAIPHISPAAHADLHGFFATPPDPRKIAQPLLAFSQECDDLGNGQTECSDNIELQVEYLNAFFSKDSDIDWSDGNYDWTSENDFEDSVQQVASHLRSKGLTLDN